jgi:hypothetical protein
MELPAVIIAEQAVDRTYFFAQAGNTKEADNYLSDKDQSWLTP